jgi:hypothetical protein
MRRTVRIGLLVLCVTLVLGSGVTVFEPYRPLTDQQTEYFVSPDISPSALWSHARLNTKQASHTMVVKKYAPASNETRLSKRVYRYDPQSRQVRSTLYYRDDGNWSTSHLYYGEQVKATAIGDASSPTRSAVSDVSARTTTQYNAFVRATDDYLTAEQGAYALEHLNTTSQHLVVGVTSADGYADFHQIEDERILNGSSYRAYVDRDTGRVTKVVETRRYRDTDDETRSVRTVIRFEQFGNTSVSRPDWADWSPLELIYDALSL